jgi:hypothetical protein
MALGSCLLLLSVPLVVTGCDIFESDEDDKNEIEAEGVVRFVDLEGGCWTIVTEDETYEPINLPVEFQVDGLDVEFEGEIRTDIATTCQVGVILDIDEIEVIGG